MRVENNGVSNALRIIDLITPKYNETPVYQNNHLRLIQVCMQDLVESERWGGRKSINDEPHNVFDEILDWSFSSTMSKEETKTDESTLSCALSSYAFTRDLKAGVQLHCLAVKTGFDVYVYVGSSLISLYSRCGDLDSSYNVFDKMPVRNAVTWTAMIASFAQHWEIEMCLELYHQMRCSALKPNDYTLTSLISACTGTGVLGHGKSAHGQTIRMGFELYTHVANAIISMYSKCGNVEEAFYVFRSMQRRDLISWNSMIAGYAQHGLAERAINLFEEMEKGKIEPDAITFLGILSSCRHAGLVKEGRACFSLMFQHGVQPAMDHYSCIVDLLGRCGLLDEALEFIQKMPIRPNAVIWGSLLSSSRLHGNVHIGVQAADSLLFLEPDCAATFLQLVNLYASAGCWDKAARARKIVKDRGLKTYPGHSWIELRNEVYRFGAEGMPNDKVNDILGVVDGLSDNMRRFGYVPNILEEGLDL
ncbi:hypothetical protein GIB67_031809 [Kingdonia uniflora]|uniref:Pentatricopeptide repeat-containing protein n=1 Tax=Kingdonia uniflora TaxID=39325 RepID=A0A7J7L4I9_9MAGN|nr:hypothetical protein GIB67_031809 [Kingdonia uniflora]